MSAAMPAKAWATLQARAALLGLSLLRSDPADGPVRILVQSRDGLRELLTLDDIEALAAHVAPGG